MFINPVMPNEGKYSRIQTKRLENPQEPAFKGGLQAYTEHFKYAYDHGMTSKMYMNMHFSKLLKDLHQLSDKIISEFFLEQMLNKNGTVKSLDDLNIGFLLKKNQDFEQMAEISTNRNFNIVSTENNIPLLDILTVDKKPNFMFYMPMENDTLATLNFGLDKDRDPMVMMGMCRPDGTNHWTQHIVSFHRDAGTKKYEKLGNQETYFDLNGSPKSEAKAMWDEVKGWFGF